MKKIHSFIKFLLPGTVCLITVLLAVHVHGQRASIVENISQNEGLPSNYIFAIAQDHQGYLWMGSDRGLIKYSDGKFITFDADNGLPGNYVNEIVPDGKNGLLIYLSEKGLYYFDTKGQKITYIYKDFGPHVKGLRILKSPVNRNYMLVETQGNRMFAIHRHRLDKVVVLKPAVNPKTGFTDYYLIDNGKKVKVFESRYSTKPTAVYHKDFLYKLNGRNGVLRYKDGEIYDTLNERNGLGSNMVSSFLKTTKGDLYFSSYGGGISIMRASNNRYVFPLNNLKVRAINYEAGKYYLLSDGYLYILNRDEVLARIFLKRDALTFFIEGDKLYVGSFSGLDQYQLRDNQVEHITSYPLTTGISKIRKHNGLVYFSTYGGGVFQENGDKFNQYSYPVFNNIENFFQNQDSSFVITSYESGFSLIDKNLRYLKNYGKKEGLLTNNISFTFGEKDTLWVGTKNGLSALVKGEVAKTFGEREGFMGSAVRMIFRSQKNELWLVTDKMILKKAGNVLKPLGSLNILGNTENHIVKSIYWKDLNELAISTSKSFSIIKLDDIDPNENPPVPVIERITVDGKEIEASSEIELDPDNFQTDFYFKSINNDFLNKVQYYYQINDSQWSPINNSSLHRFYHLDHGEYVFRVKSVNSDGYEKMYAGQFKLKVLRHFYLRWWFILGSILLTATLCGVILYFFYRSKFRERLQVIQFQEKLEEERNRISRDLHDNIGAYTTSLINKVDQMKKLDTEKVYVNKLEGIRENASIIMSLLRQTIWVLSTTEVSLDGFIDNFMSYVHKVTGKDSHIKIKFIEDIQEDRMLDPSVAVALFRIMQEALHNVLKHSEATEAEFYIKSEEYIELRIRDNGIGMRQVTEGNGLKNMKQRSQEAGFTLYIYSNSEGTTISLKEKHKHG